MPTLVFDEVDAGVGGRAAVEVGRRLARLARGRQVFVVTHLAQVAAYADRHIVVDKPLDAAPAEAGARSAAASRPATSGWSPRTTGSANSPACSPAPTPTPPASTPPSCCAKPPTDRAADAADRSATGEPPAPGHARGTAAAASRAANPLELITIRPAWHTSNSRHRWQHRQT